MIVDLDGFTVYSEQEQLDGTVKFKMTDLKNWYSSPPIRIDITEIPASDNAFAPTRAYRGSKSMSLEGVCYASDTESAIRDAYQQIAALAPLGMSMTMTVTDAAGTLTQQVWLTDSQVIPFGPRKARFQISLNAPDGRKYEAAEVTSIGPAGGAGDGMIWPLFAGGYLDFGAFSPSGLFTLTNIGTAPAWPTFVVQGALTGGFAIVSGSHIIQYDADLAVGQEVTLSSYAGGRAIQGTSDVTYNMSSSDWVSVLPGQSRNYVFEALGTADANAQTTVTFSGAWW